MTPNKELLSLASRVEALDGPSREVDAEIAVAVSRWPDARVVWHKGMRRFLKAGPGRMAFPVAGGKGTNWGIAFQEVRYTRSMDASLTLVPEGTSWDVGIGSNSSEWNPAPYFGAQVSCEIGRAKSPALALTAAALRARAYAREAGE